jgi:hypothetical protein
MIPKKIAKENIFLGKSFCCSGGGRVREVGKLIFTSKVSEVFEVCVEVWIWIFV